MLRPRARGGLAHTIKRDQLVHSLRGILRLLAVCSMTGASSSYTALIRLLNIPHTASTGCVTVVPASPAMCTGAGGIRACVCLLLAYVCGAAPGSRIAASPLLSREEG